MKPLLLALLAAVVAVGLAACSGNPPPPPDTSLSSELRGSVGVDGIREHARRFQVIADEHGGNRAAGTPGYDASAAYVADELRGAGYDVEVQSFEFPGYVVVRDVDLEIAGTAAQESDFALMERSGAGEAEGRLRPVDAEGPTSGCESEDFEGFSRGDVALLRRGACTFRTKAENAEAAGAAAVLIFNAGQARGEVLRGSLGGPGVGIPVMGTSEPFGEELLAGEEVPEVRVFAAEGGSNFWGAQTFEQGGDEYVAASDRDFGLYIFKYTGN